MPSTPSDHPRASAADAAEPNDAATRFRFAEFTFDVGRRELLRRGVRVDMPVRVFECLHHLIAHRGRAVGRDELAQAVFRRAGVSDGQLSQLVLRARRCVDDDGQAQRVIFTVPRFGFRWVAGTSVVDRADVVADAKGSVAPSRPEPTTAPLDGAMPSATTGTPPRVAHWRRPMTWIALCLVLLVAGWLALGNTHRRGAPGIPVALPSGAVVVLPARVEATAEAAWIRLGLMDFMAERLRRAGLPVPPSESTLALLHDARAQHARAGTALEPASGAPSLLVDTRVQRTTAGWRVALSARDRDGLVRRASADGGDLLDASRLACDRLLAMLGRTAPDDGGVPLALEERLQRVRAAILANQLDAARTILLAAPAAQLSQPQLRFRLAQVDYRAGALAEAERSLARLAVEPSVQGDALFRARVMIYLGGVHVRRNALTEAEHDFDTALGALAPHDADLEHGAALNGRATVRAALGRIDEALADFGSARSRLLRAGDRLGVARVDANLGALELERGHPAQAVDYLQGALAVFVDAAAINELQVTRSALSAAHLQRLDAPAALAVSDAAMRLLPRTPDSTLRLAAHLDRANALISLRRFGEARRLLDDPAVAKPTTPAYEQRRAWTRVELAWRSGDPQGARRWADRALADWPAVPGDVARGWVALRRTQALAVLGDPAAAFANALVTIDPESVPSMLAAAVAGGEAGTADGRFQAALALAEARGAPADIVEATALYVPWLIRHGRLSQADALVGRVAPWSQRSSDVALMQRQLAVARREPAQPTRARATTPGSTGERRAADVSGGARERR